MVYSKYYNLLHSHKKKIFLFIGFILFYKGYYLIAQKTVNESLVIRTTADYTCHDLKQLVLYGFASNKYASVSYPPPTIYLKVGDTLNLEVMNISQYPQTVYVHGFDNISSELGNPITSFSIGHRYRYTYRMIAKQRGCYVYYGAASNMPYAALGMYGLVIVNDDRENTVLNHLISESNILISSELDTSWISHATNRAIEQPISAFSKHRPSYFLLNYSTKPNHELIIEPSDEQYKCSYFLVNSGMCDIEYIFPNQLRTFWIGSDSYELPYAISTDTILLTPGERQEVVFYSKKSIISDAIVNYYDLGNKTFLHQKKIRIEIKNERKNIDGKFLNCHNIIPNSIIYNEILNNFNIYNKYITYNILGKIEQSYEHHFLFNKYISINSISDGWRCVSIKDIKEGERFYKLKLR